MEVGNNEQTITHKLPETYITPEIQKVINAIVGKRIAKVKEHHHKELEEAVKQAEKRAVMSEKNLRVSQDMESLSELKDWEQRLQEKERNLMIKAQLVDQRLSPDLYRLVASDDAVVTTNNIRCLREEIDREIMKQNNNYK